MGAVTHDAVNVWLELREIRPLMDYNSRVERTAPHLDTIRLVRFASVFWIGYLIVLALVSLLLLSPPHASLLYYYGSLMAIALLCLGLAYWRRLQARLRQGFILLIVAIVTVMPLLVNHLFGFFSPLGFRFIFPQSSMLAVSPLFFVGLLLVAWQYRWPYILGYILGVTGANLGILWFYAMPGTLSFQGWLVIALIQAVIFLAVGFIISYIVGQLRRQQQSLETANTRLTHYASTLEQLATTRERNRLSRELHDTLAHTLSALSVQLETLKAYWDVDQKEARSLLDKSLTTARSGLIETRRALQALRASPLDDLGLALAITAMARDAAQRAHLALELSITNDLPTLSPNVEHCFYRVAQEAITNAVSHAGAKKLVAKLGTVEGKTTLIVEDDGVGFDTEKVNKKAHFGLIGMQEHAYIIRGELDITSQPGTGTKIRLTV
jgi:signal transduction histidine kinase